MASSIWRPWEKTSIKQRRLKATSEEMQQAVLNVYRYMCSNHGTRGAINATSDAFQMHRNTVSAIIARGKVINLKPGSQPKAEKFRRIDGMWKSTIQQTIYGFYRKKLAPSLEDIYDKLIEDSKNTDFEFPYAKTTLYHIIKHLGFQYKKTNNKKVLMESTRIVEWRYRYLEKIKKYRDEGYHIVYLDETWYDSHEVSKMMWEDGNKECHLSAPPSKGKRIVIVHAGCKDGFIPNCLLLCGKKLKECHADYHSDMNGEVFEDWFEKSLLQNLPKDKKCVIVMDNAKYHSRLVEKTPSMKMKKSEMLAFIEKHKVKIPTAKATKPILLAAIREANIPKEFVIDKMAVNAGHIVHRLPPYHCVLNPIEIVWSQMKFHCRRNNVYTGEPEMVLELIKNVFEFMICPENWSRYEKHVILEEEKFRKMDCLVDTFIEPVIIYPSSSEGESDYDDDNDDE